MSKMLYKRSRESVSGCPYIRHRAVQGEPGRSHGEWVQASPGSPNKSVCALKGPHEDDGWELEVCPENPHLVDGPEWIFLSVL